MMIVETSVDPRVLHFVHKIARAIEVVCCMRYQAVNRKLQIRCAEVAFQDRRDSAGHTAMSRGVLRVGGSSRQRRPVWICQELGIATASMDSCYWTPKAEEEFRVPAADSCVCIPGPQHGQQSRRVGGAQSLLSGKSAKCPPILLSGMLCPEQATLRLLRSPHRAVEGAESSCLIVIVDPFLAVEGRGTLFRKELPRSRHCEWQHLTQPRSQRRRKCWRRRLPRARADRRSVRDIG